MLMQVLERLQGDETLYSLALRYAIARDGDRPERPDKYQGAVKKMLAQPERAQFENLALLFKILGVDIEAAIAVAASQVKPQTSQE
jgi:hypothetical protein